MTNLILLGTRSGSEHLRDISLHGWQNLSKSGFYRRFFYQSFIHYELQIWIANHKQTLAAIDSSGLIERPWKCKNGLPVCGPALFKFPLSINSRIAWKNAGEIIPSNR